MPYPYAASPNVAIESRKQAARRPRPPLPRPASSSSSSSSSISSPSCENKQVTRGSLSQVRLYHPPAHHKEPTMDELPVPQGSWKADYDAKQTGYNLQLLAGVTLFTITLGVVSARS
ncbi:unnamed protein product [Timema podura]|uniref:Deltamethrin resistance protein prag01 domain-containing protein n=1 Tax=Timema podura TaxID=61482 RepID=A0ABN7PEY3_TIMPD|nr:unnamed protein product [Timema podura]